MDTERLAELIGDDDDDDEETEEDRLRTFELLHTGGMSEELDAVEKEGLEAGSRLHNSVPVTEEKIQREDSAEVVPSSEIQNWVKEHNERRPVVKVVATHKREESKGDSGEEDELDFVRGKACLSPDRAVTARLVATRHDALASKSELAVDCVWENEARDGNALLDSARRKLLRGDGEVRPWRPCRGGSRGVDARPAFESPTRLELGACFEAARGPPETTPLPDPSWRWLSPWLVDSSVHGSDRVAVDGSSPDEWLYGHSREAKWPTDDVGYATEDNEARVRCRRWVRPRERLGAGALLDVLLDMPNLDPSLIAQSYRDNVDEATGLIDMASVVAQLGLKTQYDQLQPPAPGLPPSLRALGASIAAAARNATRPSPSVAPPSDEGDGVVLDFVWENQRWRPGSAAGYIVGGGTWTSAALVRRAPFEGSRPGLDALFKKFNGPPSLQDDIVPEHSGLPPGIADAEWRWLGPWVVDSTSFGCDRTAAITDAHKPLQNGWLYAFDWPKDDRGYRAEQDPSSFVRCRRWVRPREKFYAPQNLVIDSDSPSPTPHGLKLFE